MRIAPSINKTQPPVFPLRVTSGGTVAGSLAIVALNLLLIAVAPLSVKVAAIVLLGFTVYGLAFRRFSIQEVRLESTRFTLQRGIGPPFYVNYRDIAKVSEIQWKVNRLDRSINWLATLGDGRQLFGWPYVRVFLKRRMFRVTWIPIPVPNYGKTVVLDVWETTKLLNELQPRIRPAAS